ncbi:MAG: flagellar basal body P-ring formation chaperone FlgA [Phycisphaeraceae bacterium]
MRHDEPATMMHLIRPLLLLLGVLVLLVVADYAAGDSLRVHDVTGSDGPDIVLSQVAELEGDYARRFADTVVGRFEDGEAKTVVQTSAILVAIRDSGAKLGLLDLKGYGKVTVHRTYTGSVEAQRSESEPAVANVDTKRMDVDTAEAGEPVTVHTPTTVRALIEEAIRERMGSEGGELEITFSDRDSELLRASAVAGRYEVEPVIEPALGEVSFRVYAYHGTQRVGNAQLVKARVARRVIAVIASEPVKRGELINRRQVRLREVRVDDVRQSYLIDTSLVVGQVAATQIDAGELVTNSNIRLPVAVNRRERVSVELRSRGLKITFNGIAQDEGAVGERIEVQNPQTKEVFVATVQRRGLVVVEEPAGEASHDKRKEAK